MDELMVVGGAARRSVGRTSRMLRNASAQEKAVVAATTAALFEAAEAADAVYSGCDLFRCPLCRRTLSTPMTAECGHTFCVKCLDDMDMTCTICNVELGYLRAANVLVQDVVSKWRDLHKGRHILNWNRSPLAKEDLFYTQCSCFHLEDDDSLDITSVM